MSTAIVVYDGPSMFDGRPIRALLYPRSGNTKTGNVAQLAIVPADVPALDSIRSGADASVCGSCKHRAKVPGTLEGRTCYVPAYYLGTLGRAVRAPGSIMLSTLAAGALLRDAFVRLGSWGDPGALPLPVLQDLTRYARGWTGYTHAWRTRPDLRGFCMASVDSEAEAAEARDLGWRYFRVKAAGAALRTGEITCPSESRGVHCVDCGLCDGMARACDARKSIAITVHGPGASHLQVLP